MPTAMPFVSIVVPTTNRHGTLADCLASLVAQDYPADRFEIVLVENGLALAALELPGGASLTIELGVALDLMLIALVAGFFHERIFAEFGAGDSAALRTLRD